LHRNNTKSKATKSADLVLESRRGRGREFADGDGDDEEEGMLKINFFFFCFCIIDNVLLNVIIKLFFNFM
jgi:hypothetical protein